MDTPSLTEDVLGDILRVGVVAKNAESDSQHRWSIFIYDGGPVFHCRHFCLSELAVRAPQQGKRSGREKITDFSLFFVRITKIKAKKDFSYFFQRGLSAVAFSIGPDAAAMALDL